MRGLKIGDKAVCVLRHDVERRGRQLQTVPIVHALVAHEVQEPHLLREPHVQPWASPPAQLRKLVHGPDRRHRPPARLPHVRPHARYGVRLAREHRIGQQMADDVHRGRGHHRLNRGVDHWIHPAVDTADLRPVFEVDEIHPRDLAGALPFAVAEVVAGLAMGICVLVAVASP